MRLKKGGRKPLLGQIPDDFLNPSYANSQGQNLLFCLKKIDRAESGGLHFAQAAVFKLKKILPKLFRKKKFMPPGVICGKGILEAHFP